MEHLGGGRGRIVGTAGAPYIQPMPGTGYDEDAMRIGNVSDPPRPRWLKWLVAVIAIAIGAGLASFFR